MPVSRRTVASVVLALLAALLGTQATRGADDAAGANAIQVVALKSSEPVGYKNPTAIGSLLLREFVRQAVLIAARDELGAATRDQTLRETFPESAIVVDVETDANFRKDFVLKVKLQAGDPPKVLTEVSLPLRKRGVRSFDCVQVIEQAESWSRNEFVAALKQAGVKDQRPKQGLDGGKGIAQAEALLATSTDLLAMLNAARLSHTAASLEPASPRTLSALIRAYSILGIESEFLWCATDRAFHARALLYAERWVRRDPKSVDAIQHRAFARALAGMHDDALADLASAKNLPAVQPPPKQPGLGQLRPSWVAAIEPLCKYQTEKLVAAMKEGGENDPLLALLCFRTVRYATSQAAVIGHSRAALRVNPGALSVVDRAAQLSGVSGGHVFTEAGPTIVAALTHDRLRAAKDLPANVRAQLGDSPEGLLDPANAAKILDSLSEAAAGDRTEPSWSAMAHVLEEVHFVHAFRRANFLANRLNVDSGQYVVAQRRLVGRHPYWKFIVAQAAPAQAAELIRDIFVVDVDDVHISLTAALATSPRARDQEAWIRTEFHVDPVANSFEKRLSVIHEDNKAYARLLVRCAAEISPDMPLLLATQIRIDPNEVPGGLAAVEKSHGAHPTVGASLIKHYLAKGDQDAAIRAINRYVELSPDAQVFLRLADIYDRRGDEAMWMATLKRLLEAPDYGLVHAQVNMQIAYRYMARKDFAAAEPYADNAGASFAEWALNCQIQCKEGLGKFAEAEQLVIAQAKRYGEPDNWLIWCLRTGKGNLAGATRVAEAYDQSVANEKDRETIVGRLTYRWAIGKRLEGAKIVQEHVVASGDSLAGLLAAVAFDEAKDPVNRDLMVKAVATRGHLLMVNNRARVELVAIAKAWQTALADPKSPITVDQLIAHASLAPAGQRHNAWFVGAAILKRVGDDKGAIRLLAKCMIEPAANNIPSVVSFAAAELRQAGVDPTNDKKLAELAKGG